MTIAIRTIGADDWREFRAVRLEALATDPEAYSTKLDDWQGEGDTETRWRKRLGAKGSITFLATLDDAGAGIASGFPGSTAKARELISMWVAPFARGRGVGIALLDAVASWAKDDRARLVELAVMVDNDKAISLYERYGFIATGEESVVDERRREKKMIKALAPAHEP
jgi:ribosomal protein S18 acetylase RimI-like enzyme